MPDKKNLKAKIGLMGGSFSPFHLAHLNSLLTVREQFDLQNIILIPSFQTPMKKKEEELSPLHRLKMLKRALKSYPFMTVDDQEILRKGVSYTHRTISQFFKKKTTEELFFIMGLDQFYIFDKWKNFKNILEKTNLIVTSRPGIFFPKTISDFPKGLKALTKSRSAEKTALNFTEKKIYFCPLKDMDISSSHIRKRLKEGKEISHLLPPEVGLYIREQGLWTEKEREPEIPIQELIDFCIRELKKKKAYDIKSFDLRSRPLPFSYSLISTGSNIRQTRALALHIKKKIRERFGLKPLCEEGKTEAQWIVFDYGELVIHIFYDYSKRFYKLEELWTAPSALLTPPRSMARSNLPE